MHCRMLGVQNVPVRTKHIGIICMKSASSGYVKIINWPRVLEDSIVKVVRTHISDSKGLVKGLDRGFRLASLHVITPQSWLMIGGF